MKIFDVYPLFPIEIIKGSGTYVYDSKGHKYLDLYGGHAVISIGHGHPHYKQLIHDQLEALGFYSNSVEMPVQNKLAELLGKVSGNEDYQLFLCNSGAEAVENALKLASFQTGRKKVVSFSGAFHGRTTSAISVTDQESIKSAADAQMETIILPFNQLEGVEEVLNSQEIAAVIVEGIQGLAGIYEPSESFLKALQSLCKSTGTLFIIDEVQSGCGRTGKYFAYQHYDLEPDLITMAKGFGNGFPVGGVMIHSKIPARFGLLGSTFGGNPLACAAAIAVLEVLEQENLMQNATDMGCYIKKRLKELPLEVKVRGKGLMLGIEFPFDASSVRKSLLHQHKIFTGISKNTRILRLLPPLTIGKQEVDYFISSIKECLQNETISVN